mmetsp:Transcript_4312/g.15475  ORF Transcript_4312/g.15475 Transcript_4312/m.15475 type:complete len:212 (-) Transcript_4312:1517-2152(-)
MPQALHRMVPVSLSFLHRGVEAVPQFAQVWVPPPGAGLDEGLDDDDRCWIAAAPLPQCSPWMAIRAWAAAMHRGSSSSCSPSSSCSSSLTSVARSSFLLRLAPRVRRASPHLGSVASSFTSVLAPSSASSTRFLFTPPLAAVSCLISTTLRGMTSWSDNALPVVVVVVSSTSGAAISFLWGSADRLAAAAAAAAAALAASLMGLSLPWFFL